MPGDPYGDILAESEPRMMADRYRKVPATIDLVVLHRATGLRGKVNKFTEEIVEIRDPAGREHRFRNLAGAFAVQGETVTLVRAAPRPSAPPGLRRTAAGALVADDAAARVARASRLWVEGQHDASMLERVWGDDLRDLGIVVEPLGGIDHLEEQVAEFGPGPQRRLAVLVDHLVDGSKESRIAARVEGPDVLVVGHPFVDIWQCVRPGSLGIAAWPEVPRGEDWKRGACERLGWGSPQAGWRRVLAAVDSFADLEPGLVGAVERALDLLSEGA